MSTTRKHLQNRNRGKGKQQSLEIEDESVKPTRGGKKLKTELTFRHHYSLCKLNVGKNGEERPQQPQKTTDEEEHCHLSYQRSYILFRTIRSQ
jgi:hypothetical protein